MYRKVWPSSKVLISYLRNINEIKNKHLVNTFYVLGPILFVQFRESIWTSDKFIDNIWFRESPSLPNECLQKVIEI